MQARIFLTLLTLGAGISTSATAQGSVSSDSSSRIGTQPTESFFKTGFYAGGFVGNSRLTAKINNIYDLRLEDDTLPVDYSNITSTSNTFQIGGVIGWRYAFTKRIMAGIDITFSRANSSKDITFRPHPRFNNSPFKFKIDKKLTITPALNTSFLIRDNLSIFGKLGISISDFNIHLEHIDHDPDGQTYHSTKSKEYGFTPSLGLEYAFSPKFSLIAETGYELYKKMNFDFRSVAAKNSLDRNDVKLNLEVFNLRIGAIYKF